MRNISKTKYKRINEVVYFNRFIQLWFNYHFLFFRSLIFRGLKLRAFTFFIKIKKTLKNKVKHDPSFIFLLVMLKITPALILKPLRVSGAVYNVPYPIGY
jgi:ribosomal protein S7